MQEIAWNISIWLMLVLAAAFAWVAANSGQTGETDRIQSSAAKIRTGLFWFILAAGVPITIFTLTDLPYAAPTEGRAQVVNATGHQWYWELSSNTVRAGTPVEFRVEAADVNHGFAVYNSNMELVAQTQAMPGYTNTLRHTFTEPGTYKIMCLEYCGLNHHAMTEEITVTDSKGGA